MTTPVLKVLFDAGHDVHYAMKKAYLPVLEHCPYLTNIWLLEDSFKAFGDNLKMQDFDIVVDLHNNLRSKRLKNALGKKSYTLKKDRIKSWIMTHTGFWRKPKKHIVDRFLDTVKDIAHSENRLKVSFFHDNKPLSNSKVELPEKYHVIAVGAAYYTKQLPNKLIADVLDHTEYPVVLIGGPEDVLNGEAIKELSHKEPINLCGKLSIGESAKIIDGALSVVSGDTGMMHLADALDKKLVAVFGSTHPILGYYPYNKQLTSDSIIIQNEALHCRPCTKQGRSSCPKGHFKCMNDLDFRSIVDKM